MIFNPQGAPGQKSDLRRQVAAAHRTAAMIVIAVGFSVGIYIAVGLLLAGRSPATSAYQMHFLIAAGMLAFASIAYRRSQFMGMRLEVIAARRGVSGLLRHFVLTTIIAAAIAEVVGVLALAITFFGGSQRDLFIIGVVGLFVTFSSYPRLAAWQKTAAYFDSISYQDSEQGIERKQSIENS